MMIITYNIKFILLQICKQRFVTK